MSVAASEPEDGCLQCVIPSESPSVCHSDRTSAASERRNLREYQKRAPALTTDPSTRAAPALGRDDKRRRSLSLGRSNRKSQTALRSGPFFVAPGRHVGRPYSLTTGAVGAGYIPPLSVAVSKPGDGFPHRVIPSESPSVCHSDRTSAASERRNLREYQKRAPALTTDPSTRAQ